MKVSGIVEKNFDQIDVVEDIIQKIRIVQDKVEDLFHEVVNENENVSGKIYLNFYIKILMEKIEIVVHDYFIKTKVVV